MTKVEFDLTIIGAGPGGTACALRAVGLGLRVALIDKRDAGGGTCLHVGCIPSKALLTASEKLREALHGLSGFGITARNVSFDLNAMMSFKNKVIADTAKGLSGLYKSAGIAFIQGTARIEAPGRVRVGERELTTDRIVIATGSVPASIPGITPDGNHIVTSEEALSFAAVPKKLAVIGAGYIGLELGSVWARLGSSV
ncbi:MAG: FAD-dependent oxidoreductase, partial [Pseudomonadota bacterium]|nr:FAD-dependent oxidoreductase [Pseudomonadota bacterium]